MASEKSEKATPKRRSDERKKGNIFQSKDAVSVAVLLTSFYSLQFYFPSIISNLINLINSMFDQIVQIKSLSIESIQLIYIQVTIVFLIIALPLLIVSMVTNIIAVGAQTRFLYSMSTIKFKLERLDLLKGIQKLFSLRSLVDLFKSILKILILAAIVYSTLKPRMNSLIGLFDMEFMQVLVFLGQTIMSVVTSVGMFFIFLALADYAYQWYEYEKNIRMSKQDIKEEYRQMEGDPQIKGKIKERQRLMSQRRMMQNVPKADVIIRNPTHYAIAVQYEMGKQRAPIILAKGMDNVALKIIEVAEKHNIPSIENKPLARGLYESVEIDQEIPEKYYHAVAEVLAFVYQLKKGKK
ncbi:MAG TPA: flagellar biosynthesis protein FlhB [Erysipelotrichaceae bacterium]|nr:flagellar biosynthesis protein FlhB [Erysipelotrichaceae bacterium]